MKDADDRGSAHERSGASSGRDAGHTAVPQDSAIRVGKSAEEVVAILDEVSSDLRPHSERAAIGSALRVQLGALTEALEACDSRAAIVALSVSRTLAIGYLSVLRPRTARTRDVATMMALVLNLEAAETIIWQIERREQRARAALRRFEPKTEPSGPQ